MRYRLAQIGLALLGFFFAVGALNVPAIIVASRGTMAYFLGALFGHALFLLFAALCFRGFLRVGRKAKLAKLAKAVPPTDMP